MAKVDSYDVTKLTYYAKKEAHRLAQQAREQYMTECRKGDVIFSQQTFDKYRYSAQDAYSVMSDAECSYDIARSNRFNEALDKMKLPNFLSLTLGK